MSKLIFDIETVGENFDELDEVTQEALTRWIKKDSESEDDYQTKLSPLVFWIMKKIAARFTFKRLIQISLNLKRAVLNL